MSSESSFDDSASGAEESLEDMLKQLAELEAHTEEVDVNAANRDLKAEVEEMNTTESDSTSVQANETHLQQILQQNIRAQRHLARGHENPENAHKETSASAANISKPPAVSEDSLSDMIRRDQEVDDQLSRRLKGVDLVFLVDVTGSMDEYIEAISQKVDDIFRAALNVHKAAIIRVGFVGYRDFDSGSEKRFEHFPLAGEDATDRFRSFLKSIKCDGGGDGPEDVAGGLQEVLRLDWQASTKVLVHIADYPAHGTLYNDNFDDYPRGDPTGLDPAQLARRIAAMKIDYTFGEIKAHTQKMTNILAQQFEDTLARFDVQSVRNPSESFLPMVLNSVSSSMSGSSQFSAQDEEDGGYDEKPSILTSVLR